MRRSSSPRRACGTCEGARGDVEQAGRRAWTVRWVSRGGEKRTADATRLRLCQARDRQTLEQHCRVFRLVRGIARGRRRRSRRRRRPRHRRRPRQQSAVLCRRLQRSQRQPHGRGFNHASLFGGGGGAGEPQPSYCGGMLTARRQAASRNLWSSGKPPAGPRTFERVEPRPPQRSAPPRLAIGAGNVGIEDGLDDCADRAGGPQWAPATNCVSASLGF